MEVEHLLWDAIKRTGQSSNQVLNQAVMKGLAIDRVEAEEEPFVVSSRPMGLRTGFDAGRLNSLADDFEASAFMAVTNDLLNRRKLG